MVNNRKAVIAKLNKLFDSYNNWARFCENLDNDMHLIIVKINEIIKYALANPNFVNNYVPSLASLLHEIKNVDKIYGEYLIKKGTNWLSAILEKRVTMINWPLDLDISWHDIKGLKLPSLDELQHICQANIEKKNWQEEYYRKMQLYYQSKRHFDITGLLYTRYELVRIDRNFVYYHTDLSGNADKDFYYLYSNERYKENNSPLNNSFKNNLAIIKKSSDISMRKLGEVYCIENGRHRVLYLINQGVDVEIPVMLTKRLEDEEINKVLVELQGVYGALVYKNNILNDDVNLVIILNGNLYVIKNKNDLETFSYYLRSGITIEEFRLTTFKLEGLEKDREIFNTYKKKIFEEHLRSNEEILCKNFSDILDLFDNSNNLEFYAAFVSMQGDYQKSLIFGYDFDEWFKAVDGKEMFIRESVLGKGSIFKKS